MSQIPTLCSLLLLLSLGLPLPVLAWQRPIHDDGQYIGLAIAADDDVALAAVLSPGVIQLTALSATGTRLAWGSVEVPSEASALPRQQVSASLRCASRRCRGSLAFVGGSADAIERAYTWQLDLSWGSRGGQIRIRGPRRVTVPDHARDLTLSAIGARTYRLWRTVDGEGIATITLGSGD